MNSFTRSYDRHISRIEKILSKKHFYYLDVSKLEQSVFIIAKKDNTSLWITIVCLCDFGGEGDHTTYHVQEIPGSAEKRDLYIGKNWDEALKCIKDFAPEKAA